jgi:[lysine-biosynthesis-protein LysW]--L-2-aminoadipate ligase
MTEAPLGVLFSRLRVEEKWIFQALEARRVPYERINDSDIAFDLSQPGRWEQYGAIWMRSLSYSRGLYASRFLNDWGIPTVNMAQVAEICGDKLATASALEKHGVPQPGTRVAFTPASALEAIEELGYPVVLKPAVGSWGRLLARVNDRDAAEAILEHKSTLGGYQHKIIFVQEYIDKPGRDIRAIVIGDQVVAAMYRQSEHWITNTARAGQGEACPITSDLETICLQAAQAVGGGVLAVDLLEDPQRGFLVNEINHTMEFHTAQPATGVDIPNLLVDYVLEQARRR